jgi:hypothetical protein
METNEGYDVNSKDGELLLEFTKKIVIKKV